MWRMMKIELFKLIKTNNLLLIALLFLYPVMWSVLAFRNEVVLIENGHSMISWILGCLFILEKPFIILFVFVLICNEIVMKEQEEKYLTMIESRVLKKRELYLGKTMALIAYYSIIFFCLILVCGSCYLLFVKGNKTMAAGTLWNKNELVSGIKCIGVYLVDKCLLLPLFLVALGRRYSLIKTVVVLVILNFIGRVFGLFPGSAQFSIWNISKKTENFVTLCQKDIEIVPAGIILTFCIFTVVGLVLVMRERHKGKQKGGS